MAEQIQLTQEKETLLMALYLRARDNRSAKPILGDRHAQEIIDKIDYDFDRLRGLNGNTSLIAARAHQFDTWTSQFLAAHPQGLVLHLACGLDSRPLRIERPASASWIDVDYPDVVELRERLYGPIDGVRMLGSSVTEERWWNEIPGDRPTMVLAEGLLMYLAERDVRQLIDRALDRLPGGQFAFDAVAGWVKNIARLQPSMRRADTGFRWALSAPETLHPGLRLLEQRSAVDLIAEHHTGPVAALTHGIARIPTLGNSMRLARYEFPVRN